MSECTAMVVLGNYNGSDIMARPSDRFVDVTAMCQANGKDWYEYTRTVGAIRFRKALYAKPWNPRFGDTEDDLVVTTRDEGGQRGHTFADRRIALHCAAWINEDFEVWVYDRIEELLTNGIVELNNSDMRARLEVCQVRLDDMPAIVRTVVQEELARFNLPGSLGSGPQPQLYRRGKLVSTTIPNPHMLPYTDLREWTHSFVKWQCDRWGHSQHQVWKDLHNELSTILDWNIEYNFKKGFEPVYSSNHSRLDMIEAKGLLRAWADGVYQVYGDGRDLDPKLLTTAPEVVDLTTVADRAGLAFDLGLSKRRSCVGSKRPRKSKKEAPVSAAEATVTANIERSEQNAAPAVLTEPLVQAPPSPTATPPAPPVAQVTPDDMKASKKEFDEPVELTKSPVSNAIKQEQRFEQLPVGGSPPPGEPWNKAQQQP